MARDTADGGIEKRTLDECDVEVGGLGEESVWTVDVEEEDETHLYTEDDRDRIQGGDVALFSGDSGKQIIEIGSVEMKTFQYESGGWHDEIGHTLTNVQPAVARSPLPQGATEGERVGRGGSAFV